MLRILFSSLTFLFLLTGFSQKSTIPFNCQHFKSAAFQKSAAAVTDNRGDSINIEHITLELDFSNFGTPNLIGKATLDIKSKLSGVNRINLDLLGLNIVSVTYNANVATYSYNDTILSIDFNTALNSNQSAQIIIEYDGPPVQIPGDWGGFYWNSNYAYNIGVSFVSDPHNFGKVWIPCFDNFTDRSTYEFFVKTDQTRKAFCNGILVEEIDNVDFTKTWHWEMNQEIPPYLASVSVADYATVYQEYNGVSSAPIPIELAAKPGDTTNLKNSFINLNNALQAFETGYGPYQFDRVGYCVTSFNAGAMEHASNITYMRAAVTGNTLYETLMAHELSHHWWGDLVTCETAEDMWLNEGWASYSEALFTEYVYGTDAYKDYVRENHDDNLRTLHVNDGGYHPVSGIGTDLTYSSTVYDKGADMAHSIRGILGDATFFSCINTFLEDHKWTAITSDELQFHLSTCSGKDLSSFFDTWIYNAGHHHFSFGEVLASSGDAGTFLVQGTIVQKLWETPNATSYIPLEVTFFDSGWNPTTQQVVVYGDCSEFEVSLPFEPVYIALDIEEKVSDATVDNYQTITSAGTVDFGLARVELTVNQLPDSAFVRAIHHYIKPDPLQTEVEGLHLSPNRYFSFEGIFPNGFQADATYKFNGGTNQTSGFLDNDFITNSEDSLVMLYKANPNDDWSLVDSFEVFTLGSANNMVGEIVVYDIQKGDYVMAIYDANLSPDTETFQSCLFTSISEIERISRNVSIYPNPTQNKFEVEFKESGVQIDEVKVYNILGNEVASFPVSAYQNSIEVNTLDWKKGTYIITLQNDSKQIFSKKIVVN